MKNIIIILIVLIPFGLFGQAEFVEPELVSSEVFIKGNFNNLHNQKYIFKDKIYFMGADASHGSELWVSDGTPQGTYMLKDCTPNGNSELYIFKANLDNLVFSVKDENGKGSLWATDGTKSGTIQLANVTVQIAYAPLPKAQELKENCGKIIFSGDDGVHGSEPWITDGTPGGTYMIQDLGVDGGSNPWFFESVGGKFVFTTNQNVGFKSVIWSTDGSKNSCNRIFQGNDGQSDIIDVGLESQLLVINSFSDPITNTGYTLISVTDGTLEGTIPILGQDKTLTGFPVNFTRIKNEVYFNLSNSWNNVLYVTDGNEKGTEKLLETNAGVVDVVNWNDKLFYHGNSDGNFISDGTKEGTFEINELTDEPVYFEEYFIMDDKLYFGDYADEGIFSIWVSDGTKEGTYKVKTMNEANEKVYFNFENRFNGNLVFSYKEGINLNKLWVTDGSEIGTKPIAEFSFILDFKNYGFTHIGQYGDYLLIIPSYQIKENYMFLLNKDGELTRVEPDGVNRANKFVLESGLAIVGELNGYLYFVANYFDSGEQLWRIQVGDTTTKAEPTVTYDYKLYPNPVVDYVNINIEHCAGVAIYNSIGTKLTELRISDGRINVTDLYPGVYFVVDEQGNNIAKFVKE